MCAYKEYSELNCRNEVRCHFSSQRLFIMINFFFQVSQLETNAGPWALKIFYFCLHHSLLLSCLRGNLSSSRQSVKVAYDTPYCCKSFCDANHPAPNWGVKNNQCVASCGGIGGTAAFGDSCSNHGMTDAGVAYDTPYCCK